MSKKLIPTEPTLGDIKAALVCNYKDLSDEQKEALCTAISFCTPIPPDIFDTSLVKFNPQLELEMLLDGSGTYYSFIDIEKWLGICNDAYYFFVLRMAQA